MSKGGQISVNPNNLRVQRRLARLRVSFEERSRQQRQKYERELRAATEIGRLRSLGDVVGVYADKRSDNGSGWGIFLFMLIFLVGISVVGMASSRLIGASSPDQLGQNVTIAAGLVLGLIALLIFSIWLMRRQPTYDWLYAYSDGLAIAQQRVNLPDLVRWDDVESLYNIWQNIFNPLSEDAEPRFAGYRLRLTGGRELTISLSYRNMLDPYAPLGPLFARILPSPVAETIPSYPTIGKVVEQGVIQRKLPEALRALRGGRPIEFGELRLDSLGLAMDQGRKTLAWNDLQSITLEQDSIVVKQNGHRSAWAKFSIAETPNAVILLALPRHPVEDPELEPWE
jgi:hypothetical protein